jgi:DNA-binding NarL/FixJ family response regulator
MNIFLAEASSDVRLALQLSLDNEPGLNVIGLAVRAEGLLVQIEVVQPDVLLLDRSLVSGSLNDFMSALQKLKPRPLVIVLSINLDEEQSSLAAGADAFFCKAYPVEELLTILRKMRDEVKQKRPE